jgi:uncharacterized protein (TIGR02145 family)
MKGFEVSKHLARKETYMHNIKVIFAFFIAVSVSMAQSVNISGKVTDSSGTAISRAFVKLEAGGQVDTTEVDGSFALTGNSVNNKSQIDMFQQHQLSATINNGLLHLNVTEKSVVQIVTYTLQGKAISTVQQLMDAGTHTIALPQRGASVYLYKVKSGRSEFVLMSNSIGGISQGTAVSVQGPSSYTALAKQEKVTAAINDVIAVTKTGYLDSRVTVTNSDTSGIEIKMIVCEGTVTDTDGIVYQTVKIGNQVWTVENLRTTKYNDGSVIPLVTDSVAWNAISTPGYCFYKNTTNADSIRKFGALYNWYTVNTMKLAPTGWHVPTDEEWDTLQNYLIATGYNWDGTITENKIAKSLAAKTDWSSYTIAGVIGNNLTTNNRSGFSAVPGGSRDGNGIFYDGGYGAFWWNAADSGVSYTSYYRYLTYASDYLHRDGVYNNHCGFSVRLVMD